MNPHLHHLEHLILYSLVLWQAVLGIKILLGYLPKKEIRDMSSQQSSIITEEAREIEDMRGVIEADFDRDIFVEKADSENIESDEIIDGEVKTHKEQLKKLRG